jgi:hypothetical protein
MKFLYFLNTASQPNNLNRFDKKLNHWFLRGDNWIRCSCNKKEINFMPEENEKYKLISLKAAKEKFPAAF